MTIRKPTDEERAAFKRSEMERVADLHPGVSELISAAKVDGARAVLRYYGFDAEDNAALLTRIFDEAERESSLGRDAEGHLVLTLGPGAESPSRKGERADLKGLSPLEAWNEDANR